MAFFLNPPVQEVLSDILSNDSCLQYGNVCNFLKGTVKGVDNALDQYLGGVVGYRCS